MNLVLSFPAIILCNTWVTFAAIASELRGRWQDSRRSSSAKEDINVVRWEQCKQLLQSGKHKVHKLPFRKCYVKVTVLFALQYLHGYFENSEEHESHEQ